MADELAALIEDATARDDVRVVELTGTGERSRGTGADHLRRQRPRALRRSALDRANRSSGPPQARQARSGRGQRHCRRGRLPGPARHDQVVATESASFLLVLTRIGLMPEGGATATVAASIGRARAMRMALLADPLTAAEAYDAGLVHHVASDEEFPRPRGSCAGSPRAAVAFAATKKASTRDPRPPRAPWSGSDRADPAAADGRRGRGLRAFGEHRRPGGAQQRRFLAVRRPTARPACGSR